MKNFWKGLTIWDAIKNIFYLWKELKKITKPGVGKKLTPTIIGDSEEYKSSVEEVSAVVVEIGRQLELQLEPEHVTELYSTLKI